jgi:hypothetical protein
MNRLPIFNIVLGDAEGIQVMSLVDYPAVESNFLAFSEQHKINFSVNDEEHIVFGVALRADYPIYRFDRMGEYYVVFTKDVIKQLYEKFLTENLMNNVNLNHDKETKGVYLIQSFLKDTEKGINPVGFEDVADGSWFCAYKVNNEEVWNEIKQGKFNGFSVEVFCNLERTVEEEKDLIDEILNEI